MKAAQDPQRRDVVFQEGDWVWLRLHRRIALAITSPTASKLGPRFFGPYKVLQRVGAVAYRL